MKEIRITKGTGSGPTPLSAFDAALYAAGIGNYNLIHLSSVIPPNHIPVLRQVEDNERVDTYGTRLYLVYAAQTISTRGMSAYSGLGWVLTEEDPTRGLFVEHIGHSEQEVQRQIEETLTSMVSYRKEKYGPINSAITGVECVDKPVCAIVAAVYENEPWSAA